MPHHRGALELFVWHVLPRHRVKSLLTGYLQDDHDPNVNFTAVPKPSASIMQVIIVVIIETAYFSTGLNDERLTSNVPVHATAPPPISERSSTSTHTLAWALQHDAYLIYKSTLKLVEQNKLFTNFTGKLNRLENKRKKHLSSNIFLVTNMFFFSIEFVTQAKLMHTHLLFSKWILVGIQ